MEINKLQKQLINTQLKTENLDNGNKTSDSKIREIELKKTSRELEGFFLTHLFKSMEKNI